jgi:hypothetical protein
MQNSSLELLLGLRSQDSQPRSIVDPQKTTPPWDGAIEVIQTPFLRIERTDFDKEVSLQLVEYVYTVAAHWVYKKRWHNRHKIPGPKRVHEAIEPMADVILAYCNLCIELQIVGMAPEYPCALAWLSAIVAQMKHSTLSSLYSESTKASEISETRSAIKQLRDGVNPIDGSRSPHLHRLLNAAIRVVASGYGDSVFNPLWTGSIKHGRYKIKGLIPALAGYAKLLESNSEILTICKSDLKIIGTTKGRNRPRTVLDFSSFVQ